MSVARRDEILRAEESIRALAGELAAAKNTRKMYEELSKTIEDALKEVRDASSRLEAAHDLLREEGQSFRSEARSASEDLGAATDFAHERLKETVEAFRSVSKEIESRAVEQIEDLRRVSGSISYTMRVFDERFDTLGIEVRSTLDAGLVDTQSQIQGLEETLVRQSRIVTLLLVTTVLMFVPLLVAIVLV